MRRFLSRMLKALAFNDVCCWIVLVLGTITFTVVFCGYFNTPPTSLLGCLIEIASAIFSFVLYGLISLILSIIAELLNPLA